MNPWEEGIGAPTSSLGWEGAGLPSKERESGCPQSGEGLGHPRGEGAGVPLGGAGLHMDKRTGPPVVHS